MAITISLSLQIYLHTRGWEIFGTRLDALSAIYFAVYALMQIPSGVIADTLAGFLPYPDHF